MMSFLDYRSAKMSEVLSKMKFIQNGVDEVRREAAITINKNNNEASYIRLPENSLNNRKTDQQLQTVLLNDILKAVKRSENPKQIIIKIDVELFECRAFLGSSYEFFLQKVPITAIIMEWLFVAPDDTYTEECPREKLERMTGMFLSAGYVPFKTEGISKLNYTNIGTDWRTNVVWILNTTDSIIRL